jgi:glucose/mannose-6-phosphate isomerase
MSSIMAMEDTIRRFGEQFSWKPVVEHNESLRAYKYFIVSGMGGSHLGAWLIKKYGAQANIFIHRGYGLPDLPKEVLENALIILSSYSGTTEEVLDTARAALDRGLPMAAITKGGKLLEFAREHAISHVIIPNTDLEPRMAIGYSMLGLCALMKNTGLEDNIRAAGLATNPSVGETEGARIGSALQGKIPLMYASAANAPLAYIWKIKLNETSKIPAFCNVFPELCHNELSGFDSVDSTKALSSQMHAVFLDDEADLQRNKDRMRVAFEVLSEHGVPVIRVPLTGWGFEKAFDAALLADWVSLNLAKGYNVPNPETPLISDFKKRIG